MYGDVDLAFYSNGTWNYLDGILRAGDVVFADQCEGCGGDRYVVGAGGYTVQCDGSEFDLSLVEDDLRDQWVREGATVNGDGTISLKGCGRRYDVVERRGDDDAPCLCGAPRDARGRCTDRDCVTR